MNHRKDQVRLQIWSQIDSQVKLQVRDQIINQIRTQIKQVYESKHPTNHGLSLVVSSVELARTFANFGKGAANKKIAQAVIVFGLGLFF